MSQYDDIINYNYQMKHKRMTIHNRSAQFAPFSALTGYHELIDEKGRETTNKIDLSSDSKDILDLKLQIINQELIHRPLITITYFSKDLKKEGGSYISCTDYIKRIDFTNHYLILINNLKIKISDIIKIDSKDINFNDII